MALITTTEELRQYVAVDQSLDIDNVMPDIADVQDGFLAEQIGEDLVLFLQTGHDAEDLDADGLALLSKTRKFLANMAVAQFMDTNQTRISDMGNRMVSGDRDKAAFQWMKDVTQSALYAKAFRALDELIVYLSGKANVFPEYLEAPEVARCKEYFIPGPREFTLFYNIGKSYTTYIAMRPIMWRVQEETIRKHLGDGFYEALKTAMLDELTAEQTTLVVKYIRSAVAYLTAADAVIELNLTLTAQGSVLPTLAAGGDNQRVISKTPDNLIQATVKRMKESGAKALGQLTKYLNATATASVFPEFHASELYQREPININSTDNKFFFA